MGVLILQGASLTSVQRTCLASRDLMVARVTLSEVAVRRMQGEFGRGQGEDGPALFELDETEAQNVADERAVGFRVFAVQQEMRAGDPSFPSAAI
jgi:hypothetical protein